MGLVKTVDAVTGEDLGTREEVLVFEDRQNPPPISSRQFYQYASVRGFITQAEALSVIVDKVLPASLSTFVSGLPSDQVFPAKMLLLGAGAFHRSHPMSSAIGNHYGLDEDGLDEFWLEAYKL